MADQPPRYQGEIFRASHLAVRSNWDSGLQIHTAMDPVGEIIVNLDNDEAHDLLNQLESWRAGWFNEQADRG